MHAGREIGHRDSRLDRRLVGVTGDARDAHHRLDREVHRRPVAVTAVVAVAAAARVDQSRVRGPHRVVANAEAIHHARGIILEHHVRDGDQPEELLAARLGLQVQADAALADVERHERIPGAVCERPVTQVVAGRRLDLDDIRARLREQKPGIRAVVDLTEVENAEAVERQLALGAHKSQSGSAPGSGLRALNYEGGPKHVK